ncbi:MAG: hypothetical protein ACO3EZ_14320 [Prochlorotrichaceae cyanobacterium]
MPDRSADLQQILNLLYEQLSGKEKAVALAPLEEKVRIRQQIVDLKQEIAQFEAELQTLPPHPTGSATQTIAGGTGYQVTGSSRVQQLRRDRLQRELDQLAEEYQAVSDQLSVTLNPTDQVRLKRSLEQLETRMAAIEADLD